MRHEAFHAELRATVAGFVGSNRHRMGGAAQSQSSGARDVPANNKMDLSTLEALGTNAGREKEAYYLDEEREKLIRKGDDEKGLQTGSRRRLLSADAKNQKPKPRNKRTIRREPRRGGDDQV
jgi:hypothetical protein